MGTINEDTWAQEDAAVDFVVVAFCMEIVGGGVVVGPCFAAEEGCGGGFDIVEV